MKSPRRPPTGHVRPSTGSRNPFLLSRLLIACAVLTAASLTQAQPSISGLVLNGQTGFGIVAIDLDVFDAQGHPVPVTGDATGAGGAYSIALPAAGTFFIRADPSLSDFFVDQYYSNAFLRADATLVTVGASEAVSNINFRLPSGYQIRGVIRSQGVGLADVDLDLYAANGEFLSGYPARSAADGSFTLGVLPPGSYFVRAQPDLALGQFFVPSSYGGALELSNATPVVIANGDVTGIAIELTPGGAISGHAADPDTGAPLVGFDLDLYETNRVRQPFNASTDTNGNYVIGPIPAGHYQLRVDPTLQQGYPRTYYSNVFFHAAARTIDVQAGRMTPAIDFTLGRAGAATGRIADATTGQPLAGVDLDAYDAATNRFDVTTRSDTNGHYVLGPLPPGAYFMRAQPGLTQGHLLQYYELATNVAGARPVAITAGTTTSNINFALEPAGWIEGSVNDTNGLPLGGIDLDIYEAATGTRLVLGALTTSNGTYHIGPAPPGQYHLRCDPTISQSYAVEYFNGQLTGALADPIVVNAGTGTSNVNFTLDPGGVLSGRVVAADTSQPVAALDMDVLQAGTLVRLDQSAITDLDGRFTVGPLPAGSYLVRADPGTVSGYLRTYYGDAPDTTAAQPIALTAPGAVANLDIQLIAKLPPQISTDPQSQTVGVGSNVTFSVTATGTSPLAYQWFFEDAALTNAVASMLVLNEVQLSEAGRYWVVVTNLVGSSTSVVAVLTVVVPPTITAQPASLTVAPGQAATFTIMADGTAPLFYEWRRDGVALSNSNDHTYTIPRVTQNDAGVYTVVISNILASAVSAPATLTVTQSLSAPRLLASQPAVGMLRISLQASPAMTYQLEVRPNLGDGAWAPSGAPLTNGTGTVSWDLPLDGLSRFYRVQAH